MKTDDYGLIPNDAVTKPNIINKELEKLLGIIIKKIYKYNEFIALGLGGSYALDISDIYSDLDIFLILDLPRKNFNKIIEDIFSSFGDEIIINNRGNVRYLGYTYNVMLPSLNSIDLFVNNKETFEPCYLTRHMKIIIDNHGWLRDKKECFEKYNDIDDTFIMLASNYYNSFIFDSWKVIISIRRNELLNAIYYVGKIVDYLMYLIRIKKEVLGSHPGHPRAHFEKEIKTNVDFSKLIPSYNKKEIIICFRKLTNYFFYYLNEITNKYPIKRNLNIEEKIQSELKVISEETK